MTTNASRRLPAWMRILIPSLAAILFLAIVGVVLAPVPGDAVAAGRGVFASTARPTVLSSPDRKAIELGVRLVPKRSISATGVRFFGGPRNTGPHTGTLWDSHGHKLASVRFTEPAKRAKTGSWQTVAFVVAVKLQKGKTYTVSYTAPHGGYSMTRNGFRTALSDGVVTYPRGAGVYSKSAGAFPKRHRDNTNYFVDLVYSGGPSTVGASPSPSTTGSASATPTATATPGAGGSGSAAGLALDLPRIPWEGGSAYWKQFPYANAAGWSDPSFFPVVVWFNGISSDAEAQYDKAAGINTYIGMDANTPYSLFADNDVYWIGEKLNSSFTSNSTNWVGNFLEDEEDGRASSPAAGREFLQKRVDSVKGNGRFNYANYTQMVISSDLPASDANAYVNDFTDVTSMDMYWYTIPYCSSSPYRDTYLVPVSQANCRTASSYGKVVEAMRKRDASDGKLQPIWQFVEDLNGGPGKPHVGYITPGQLQGAVMNSIINEARGIVYFNTSLSGPCDGGSILRMVQVNPNFCAAPQIQGMTTVDAQVHSLAPVINTQSYQYTFGPKLDTMLKSYDGSLYVFAMIDGSGTPGSRNFQLPPGVSASSAQVMFENRTVPISRGGSFSDSFTNEYSYHIYKITPGS